METRHLWTSEKDLASTIMQSSTHLSKFNKSVFLLHFDKPKIRNIFALINQMNQNTYMSVPFNRYKALKQCKPFAFFLHLKIWRDRYVKTNI